MTKRSEFEMTQTDMDKLLAAMKPAPLIAIHTGMPPSPQESANRAWCELGDRMGFDGMTVEPTGRGDRFFTAIGKEPTKANLQPGIHIVFDAFPGPDGCRFIEVENEHGKSIKVGEWVSRPDGLVALVIPT